MAFDQTTRNRLQKFVSEAKNLLSDEFTRQLQNDYGMDPDTGTVSDIENLPHLTDAELQTAKLLRETVGHYQTSSRGSDEKEILSRIVREQAFTVLNRLCALRMAEARGILIESISKGYNSKGFQLYARVANTSLGESGDTYRNYLFSVFDEFAMDLAVLFDRYSPMGRLFPKESVLLELLDQINDVEIETLWAEDETIGWIYQYFNSKEERKKMRDESSAPRNSRELAVRNQFFTPRYVVEFLTDNTLGRIWYEMTLGDTRLKDQCRYLVRRPHENFLKKGEKAPEQKDDDADLTQEELLNQPVYIEHRPVKDPREILMLDPACGSMHFGLYAFDLFEKIYEEAWDLQASGKWQGADSENFGLLSETYTTKEALLKDIPRLIIENNIHGVDIDPRAVQIAGLSLWLRAQRSWKEQNIKPNSRPQIRKSNIVCAEPMPGEKEFLKGFSENLKPRVLGQLVEIIFEKMELAGEAGSLLKIEEEIEEAVEKAREEFNKEVLRRKEEAGYLPGMAPKNRERSLFDFVDLPDKTRFWKTAEEKILEALKSYAEQAETEDVNRLRLFAEDAAKGFAFIDLCRKQYDVVLMNPPFGETSVRLVNYLGSKYPSWNKNILCAFIEQGYLMSHEKGASAAIYDRTSIVKSTYENFRRTVLVADNRLSNMADLGWGVLDANVEVTTSILHHMPVADEGVFLDCREIDVDEKGAFLEISISDLSKGLINKNIASASGASFAHLPNAVIGYDFPGFLISAFKSFLSLENCGFKANQGFALKAEKHFRTWWEVPPNSRMVISRMFNGGGFSPFVTAFHNIAISPVEPEDLPMDSSIRKSGIGSHRKMGICFGKRGDFFCTHILPKGHIFTVEGQSIPIADKDLAIEVLGLLNTPLVRYSLNKYCGQHKYSGYVNLFPYHRLSNNEECRARVEKVVEAIREVQCGDETQSLFSIIQPSSGIADRASLIGRLIDSTQKLRLETEAFCHEQSIITYRVSSKERSEIEDFRERQPNAESPISDVDLKTGCVWFSAHSEISIIIGIVFGRWDIRISVDSTLSPKLTDLFEPLPNCPPGMLIGPDGLPAQSRRIVSKEWLRSRPTANTLLSNGAVKNPTIQDTEYPVRIAWNGIIVDDKSHSEDIITRIRETIEVIWKEKANDIEQEACEILGVRTLREYFSKPAKFFAGHLKRYSKSRRQAPIYWPLSTPSGSYTLWIYYHRLSNQTLYTCVNNFVGPKLKQISDDADNLRKKTTRSRQEEKELEKLSDLAVELKDFDDELLRIAKFWKPNLNDGVQITAAPLWKLFQHKPWQKKLKQTWKDLEKGKYDWAHLAYSIWPERVIRASHKDRSYAIAHDLEDDLWEEIKTGKDRKGNPKTKWVPKELSEKELKELIAQKTEGNQ